MKQFSRSLVLGDLSEADFNNWKHHPISKLVRRFLRDRERQVVEHQIAILRKSDTPLSEYATGEFKGHANALAELAELEFQHIVEFYPSDEEETEGQE